MKKFALFLLVSLLLFSCESDANKLVVQGVIKGLKKGTVYLKKANDNALVTLDSIVLNGSSNFKLETAIEAPEVFYIFLDKNDNTKDAITFFGDKGLTEINTALNNFSYAAKIKGSKQQEILNRYLEMMSKFNDKKLDLIKDDLNAKIGKDSLAIANAQRQLKSFTKRKYLYTTNFAITNKDSEVAPYLAITQLIDANVKLLDTINGAISPRIKNSKYGKELQGFINKIKTNKSQ